MKQEFDNYNSQNNLNVNKGPKDMIRPKFDSYFIEEGEFPKDFEDTKDKNNLNSNTLRNQLTIEKNAGNNTNNNQVNIVKNEKKGRKNIPRLQLIEEAPDENESQANSKIIKAQSKASEFFRIESKSSPAESIHDFFFRQTLHNQVKNQKKLEKLGTLVSGFKSSTISPEQPNSTSNYNTPASKKFLSQKTKRAFDMKKKDSSLKKLEEELQVIEEKQQKFHDKLLKSVSDKKSFNGTAIISFTTMMSKLNFEKYWKMSEFRKSKYYFLKMFYCNKCNCCMKIFKKYQWGNRVLICKDAFEPADVIWENIGVPLRKKFWYRLLNWFVCLILWMICFSVIIIIKYNQVRGPRDSIKDTLASATLGIAITITNLLLAESIKFLSKFEYSESHTEYQYKCAWKIGFSQGANSTICICLANIIAYNQLLGLKGVTGTLKYKIWDSGSLSTDILLIVLGNTFAHPFVYYFDPIWIIAKFKRMYVKKYPSRFTQKEANQIFEEIQPDMHEWYSNIHRTLIISFFYTPALPISLLLGFISILLQYWMDKHQLVVRYSRPCVQGNQISEHMTAFFTNAILFFTVGQIFWDIMLRDKISQWSLIIFVVSSIIETFEIGLILLSLVKKMDTKLRSQLLKGEIDLKQTLNAANSYNQSGIFILSNNEAEKNNNQKKCCDCCETFIKDYCRLKFLFTSLHVDYKQNMYTGRSYENARVDFQMEYDRSNPVTSFEATKNWIEFLRLKKPYLNEDIEIMTSVMNSVAPENIKNNKNFLFEKGFTLNKSKFNSDMSNMQKNNQFVSEFPNGPQNTPENNLTTSLFDNQLNDTMNILARYAVSSPNPHAKISYANLNYKPTEVTEKVELLNTSMKPMMGIGNILLKHKEIENILLSKFVSHNNLLLSVAKMNSNVFFQDSTYARLKTIAPSNPNRNKQIDNLINYGRDHTKANVEQRNWGEYEDYLDENYINPNPSEFFNNESKKGSFIPLKSYLTNSKKKSQFMSSFSTSKVKPIENNMSENKKYKSQMFTEEKKQDSYRNIAGKINTIYEEEYESDANCSFAHNPQQNNKNASVVKPFNQNSELLKHNTFDTINDSKFEVWDLNQQDSDASGHKLNSNEGRFQRKDIYKNTFIKSAQNVLNGDTLNDDPYNENNL